MHEQIPFVKCMYIWQVSEYTSFFLVLKKYFCWMSQDVGILGSQITVWDIVECPEYKSFGFMVKDLGLNFYYTLIFEINKINVKIAFT